MVNRIIFGLIFFLVSLFVFSQNNTATFSLSHIDASSLSPGDTVLVDAYLDEITDAFQAVQYSVMFDSSTLEPTEQYLKNKHELLQNDPWIVSIEDGNNFTAFWSNGTFCLIYLEDGDLMFSLEFVWKGGDCNLLWIEDSLNQTYLFDGVFYPYNLTLNDGSITSLQQDFPIQDKNNVVIYASNSSIIIRDERKLYQTCRVFDLNGMLVKNIVSMDNYSAFSIEPGIYIIHLSGGLNHVTSKIMVNP